MDSPATDNGSLDDDLFNGPLTPAASPPPPPPLPPVASSSSLLLLKPRAIKKRTPTATAASTTKPPSLLARSLPTTAAEVVASPKEIQKLESILCVIESSFSNHGLSLYKSSGLLDKLTKQGIECKTLPPSLSSFF